MSVELVPLCTIEISLRAPLVLNNCPVGARWIVEVESATVKGDRLNGVAKGNANADWATIGPDGTASLDVRVLMETDDEALIFTHYTGRLDLETMTAYAAPRFETGDERYAWLNKIQAVGKGKLDGTTLTYEWYEVK
jgi:uncharacterized protein DUF3237